GGVEGAVAALAGQPPRCHRFQALIDLDEQRVGRTPGRHLAAVDHEAPPHPCDFRFRDRQRHAEWRQTQASPARITAPNAIPRKPRLARYGALPPWRFCTISSERLTCWSGVR